MARLFEHILLATEHTEFDVGAERVAFELAQRCALPLAGVMPVPSNPEYELVAPQLAAQAEKEARHKVEALRAAALAAGIALDMRIRRGEEAARDIIAEAHERRVDLIVVRRRGRRGFLAHLMVGEMAGKLAMQAPCSVLLVPRACHMWSRRVLAAVDASPAAAQVTTIAARIAAECSIPLLLLSVAEHDTPEARRSADIVLERAMRAATSEGAQVEIRVAAGHPHERINEEAEQSQADLVVVGRYGEHSQLHRLLLGGTAHKVIGLAHYPVLVAFSRADAE